LCWQTWGLLRTFGNMHISSFGRAKFLLTMETSCCVGTHTYLVNK
jgi:hypothetical protein